MPTQPKQQTLSDYKALLFDIDRTLMPPSGELFPEIPKLLTQLQQAGYLTGVCTGRGYGSVYNKVLSIFPDDTVHILAGGGLVATTTGKIIWQKTIEQKSLEQLIKMVQAEQTATVLMTAEKQYAQGEVLQNLRNHPWDQITAELDTLDTSQALLMYISQPSEKILSYVKNNPKLSYKKMRSNRGNEYIDVTATGITKAVALKHWAKHSTVSLEQIIGFGDSPNDIEFLTACGYAVAMGNADKEIIALADKTIGDVSDKGLPKYVQNILQGGAL